MNKSGISFQFAATVMLLLACAALVCGAEEKPEAEAEKELQIRAAFLLNFMKFTTWPKDAFEDDKTPIVLTVIGTDPFGRILEQTFAKEQIHSRQVELRRVAIPDRSDFRREKDFEEAMDRMRDRIRPSHVVYITTCDRSRLNLVFKDVDTSRMLTVGSRRECSERLSAFALDVDKERVVFYVNMSVVESLQLRVSSRILALARLVESKDPKEGDSA